MMNTEQKCSCSNCSITDIKAEETLVSWSAAQKQLQTLELGGRRNSPFIAWHYSTVWFATCGLHHFLCEWGSQLPWKPPKYPPHKSWPPPLCNEGVSWAGSLPVRVFNIHLYKANIAWQNEWQQYHFSVVSWFKSMPICRRVIYI